MKKEQDPKEQFKGKVYDYNEAYSGTGNVIPTRFGLCSTCDEFYYVQYQYDQEKIACGFSEVMRHWPNGDNPIKTCTGYRKRGQVSLMEMSNMAYYIDDKKKKLGFE
ncbi:MAG TPA: hypothetical protein PL042_05130 [Caldisericia bacterium]|jgi:hypothetical protein|nr:hypothetical protein [Caldisericia bacterium]